MDECVFCTLLSDPRAPVSMVAESDLAVAFLDAFPVAAGHTLVVPRRHVPTLGEVSAEEGAAIWSLAQQVSVRVRQTLAPAVNLHLADGAEADQEVPHVHLHVIPRHDEDQVRIDLPGMDVTREELDRVARSLR